MNRTWTMHRRQGFSIIDIMVGIVIALVAMLVIFDVFSVGEQFKRNTTAIGDAQVSGLLASFMLGLQLANAGNALAAAAHDLAACEDQSAEPDLTKRFAQSWRPIPILVFDGGAAAAPDSFAVHYSTSTTIVAPAQAVAASPGKYVVRSPNGFHPLVKGERKDLIVAIQNAPFGAAGPCAAARVDAAVPSTAAPCTAAQGCVELAYTGAALPGTPHSVFNMGAADDVQKIAYDVDTAKAVLRSTRLVDDQGRLAREAPNPIASNIVNLKLQYGIDTNADGLLDAWVSATGAWAPDVLLSAATPVATLNQIKAVRIGVIVRSEQFDKTYTQDVGWSMFDGAFAGTFARSIAPPGNWRYRVYETVIPLRNGIWNKSL